ncbi:FKBP-type peptidyl-prolyl cis-trans isomerase [Maribacter sp. 1_MG-2023]|uniref:FKBP-type peptidyl-prolyl cis-trans isomerase n=1 Tax=Maribacter sp. 1_MG-2023 TaxID=3062677 RepID=UPI0026E1E851|nr:FKBP-type peptidyl-prolyl cis-trans isomerase [Maribacter sp. 1_MG-2023]MDO6472150.1 FKBP-type peptidyl-prolyl cis-trans isomerase [Maribacter sp. 1_MG-2023]
MKYFAILLLVTTMISCGSSDDNSPTPLEPIDYTDINEKEINVYLSANDLVSETTASGLHYIIENPGDGAKPSASSNVTVAYKGYFLDGEVFDQSVEGLSIGLNQVIAGWTEGIPLFNEGGNGVLLVPSHLAYGSFDYNGIPGGSVLVFDIELISVN